TLTVSASALTPCSSRCRALSAKLRIFAIYGSLHEPPPRRRRRLRTGSGAVSTGVSGSLLDDREDIPGGEHQVLLAAPLDLGASILGVDHRVADLHVDRDPVALVVEATWAHSEDRALLRLLLRGVGNDDARRRGGLGLVRLDQDAVLERLDRNLRRGTHGHTLLGHLGLRASCALALPSSGVPEPPGWTPSCLAPSV